MVALSGHVGSWAERRAAEEAAQAVDGVRALANDIVIELPQDARRWDAEIAEAAITALGNNVTVPVNDIRLVVRDGWLTLDGEVATWYQKNMAESTLSSMRGIKGIVNNIKIRSSASAGDVKRKIEDAIRRRAQRDAESITVNVAEGAVTLEGQVSSWAQRQQIEMAAWQSPGVSKVIDNLSVYP